MLRKDMAFAVMEGTDEAKFWILGWGAKAQVIKPASLREDIRAEEEEMLEIYGKEILSYIEHQEKEDKRATESPF
jgi:hypothetical protein